MANTTPLVTTVTKPVTNPRDADATPGVNIQDFCEEYYEDILPIIMDKVRRDKRKEVLARLDFGECSRERRTREGSHYLSARTLSARPEGLKVQDRLRYKDRHVLNRLGHRRQSAFDRLSETYSPSTTKSRPGRTSSKDHSRGRSRPHRLDASNEDHPENKERFRGIKESYDNSHSSHRMGINHGYRYHDRDRSRHMKRGRNSESSLSSVSKSDSSDGRHRKSKSKRHKPTDKDDLMMPWVLPSIFHAAKKYVKDPVEIHNIKQKDGETIKDFMECFKVETGRMKGAPECMRISGFMHGVNNPKLTKRLNEPFPKTMEEMMITTTAFIRGEAAAASKKKGHTSWRTQDQSKRKTLEKRKVPAAATYGDPVEKRSSNKFCDFHNDKGHSTNECMQLKKQIEELVRAGKLSHLIKKLSMDKISQRLLVTIGDADHSTRAWMNFMIVRSLSPYNGIIGRPEIKEIQAVPSTAHGMLKFLVDGGIITIRSTILIPAKCATVITSSEVAKEAGVRHENIKVALHPNFPDQEPSDMTGVPQLVAEHRLNIQVGYSPVWQKKRGQAPERAKAIQAEVQKFVEAWIMREVYYHDWLSNPVMLAESDEETTAFHTGQRVYCYTKMSFGLKNAGATYQRLVDKAFDSQIGRNIKVYVDDLVIKSHTEAEMLRDIGETFPKRLRRYFQAHHIAYTPMEKLVLSLVFAAKRLRRYFQAHHIAVITDQPIKQIMSCLDVAGRLQKWNVILGEHNITYRPRTSVNGQVLVDFLTEIPDESSPDASVVETQQDPWTLFTDGSSSSDNEVEYEALIAGEYVAKEENMIKYLEKVKSLVLVEILKEKYIQEMEVTTVVEEDGPTQMTPIMKYLKEETLPSDRKEARKLLIKARHYELLEGVLYRWSFFTSWLRCVGPLQAEATWPFYKWGIDIAGPFPKGSGMVTFFIVAMDYFTKWIEAKAVAIITGNQVKKFMWDNIVCRFGLPREIVSDNGKQFCFNPFKDWCEKLNITQRFASVKHPQSNGLVERANRSLGGGIKACLEIGMPTYRTAVVDVVHNDEELRLNLDLLEERRERAAIHEAKAKLKMTKYYNARVRGVTFRPGDFVYRSNDASHDVDGGKLGPKWEGPYEVTEALGYEAYKLRSMDKTVLLRTWNIANLKKCYL
nr:reverse transcriptase domain-containing protein [Tanacetum cinerariifolium]